MIQKNFTLHHSSPQSSRLGSFSGYLSKLFALVAITSIIGISQEANAQGFVGTQISINATTTTATTNTAYIGGESSSAQDQSQLNFFNGKDLGNGQKFDPNTGVLTVTVASDTLSGVAYVNKKFVTYPFVNSTLFYRVYLANSTAPGFTAAPLTLTSTSNTSDPTTYALSGTIDLFAVPRSTGGGTYKVDIYYEGQYKKPNSSTTTPVTDPGSGASNPSSATFQVNAPTTTPSGSKTTWISTSSTDWSIPTNWSNGVPNGAANAIIASSDSIPSVKYPILNDKTYNYAVKNLTLNGADGPTAAQLIINVAVLHVYGNLNQVSGGLRGTQTINSGVADSTSNSTIIFKGGNQIIQGVLVVSDIIIAGSGVKSMVDIVTPTNILAFEPASPTAGVLIQTASLTNGTLTPIFDTTKRKYVQLGSSGIISTVAGQSETTTSFIKGVTRADRVLSANNNEVFGNIGLELNPNHTPATSPNPIFVYRVVGSPLNGPAGRNAKPVKRYYQVGGDDNSNSSATAGSNLDVIFHYLPSADELNGIQESNLTMFRTTNNGVPYNATGGDENTVGHYFTRLALPSLTDFTLTLGDKTNPLPVSLVAFAAVRSGANASVTWTTASEENNKGFNVQVSTNGVSFRTLGFVASQSPNSSQALSYKYTDTETGKTGTRYYRLEQVDISGKLNYSPIKAVNFDGAAATSVALVAYPNPFSDSIGLTVDGATTTEGTAYVKLVDMTGRTIRDQKVAMTGASIALSDLSELRTGLYLAKVTLPDGTTQTVRVQKQ